MKTARIAFLLTLVFVVQRPVLAQSETASTPKADVPAVSKSADPCAQIDARECLKLSTNMEIHRCAEKYRRPQAASRT